MRISDTDMEEHIATGRAVRWTRPYSSDGMVPKVAQLNGEWFYVPHDGDGSYCPVPELEAAVMTAHQDALRVADSKVAETREAEIRVTEIVAGQGGAVAAVTVPDRDTSLVHGADTAVGESAVPWGGGAEPAQPRRDGGLVRRAGRARRRHSRAEPAG